MKKIRIGKSEWMSARNLKIERHRKKRKNKKRILNFLKQFNIRKKKFLVGTSFFNYLFKRFNLEAQNPPLDKQGRGRVEVPKELSLFSNPDETLKFFKDLISYCRGDNYKCLCLDHRKCISIDLAASIVTDIILINAREEWKINKSKKYCSGFFPEDKELKEIFRATGLVKTLKLSKFMLDKKTEQEKFLLLPLKMGKRRAALATQSSEKDLSTQDVVEYINECLATKDVQLTEEGERILSKLIGEVLDNVEQHNPNSFWHIIAYTRHLEGKAECQMAVFNFGNTIYETLASCTDLAFKGRVETLVKSHTSGGLFGLMNKWEEETLWTLYAMQEGVSRFTGTEKGKDRGTGTVNMIQFFQQIGGSINDNDHAQMVLVSGKTRIHFDKTYDMKAVDLDGTPRKIIAFNEENDLHKKPDSKFVSALDHFFPGTILGLRFFLEQEYLSAKILEGERDGNSD